MKMTEYKINGEIYRLALFEKIEKPEQAYLIGYLAGDGRFMAGSHKRKDRMFVSSTNNDTIKFFSETFCPDNSIEQRLNNNNKRNIIAKKISYKITFNSKFSKIFNKCGILCLKKDRTLINIPNSLIRYYILGLFDADGSISWGRRKDRNRLWVNFQITHQSYNILHKISMLMSNKLNISTSVISRKKENCIDLKTSNRDSVILLYKFLYSDIDKNVIYNKDKYYHFKKFVSEYNPDAT